ncbi:hypothetical protein GCM10028818_14680 [Spirosoma horti]
MSTTLVLPQLIAALVEAQNKYDSHSYAALFANNAIVQDEGKVYKGPAEIQLWNEETNKKYRVTLAPIDFSTNEKGGILTVMVSGNFAGSPLPLKYSFTFENEAIKSLSIDV